MTKKILILSVLILFLFNTLSYCNFNDSYSTYDFIYNNEYIAFIIHGNTYKNTDINSSQFSNVFVFRDGITYGIFAFNDNNSYSYDSSNDKLIFNTNAVRCLFNYGGNPFGFSKLERINSYLTLTKYLNSEDKDHEIIYNNFDIIDVNGEVILNKMVKEPDKFFNFRFGTLDYSINLTGNDNFITLWEYIAVFKVDNILLIYSSKQHPTYIYNEYKHFLHTEDTTNTYGYDLKTDKIISDKSLTKYYPNGANISFDKSQLIYSNFVFKDENSYIIFSTTGDYLGDQDMKGTASGNIASGGQTSEGNSLLNDYINSQKPDYNGSSNQGSDTISGAFNNVYGNFGFAEDVKKNVNGMVDVITNTSEAPKFQLNVNSKYYKGTLTIVDLSWYSPYKEMGDNVICIFAYLGFLWRIFIRLPDIIRGAGASSYAPNMLGDIEAFRKTGFGRSSSPRDKTF